MDGNRANWVVRNFKELVGLFDSKPRAFATVGMLLIILALMAEVRRVYNARLDDSNARRESEQAIYERLLLKVEPEINQMRVGLDSAKATVDSTAQRITPLLDRVSEAVDGLNKNKRR